MNGRGLTFQHWISSSPKCTVPINALKQVLSTCGNKEKNSIAWWSGSSLRWKSRANQLSIWKEPLTLNFEKMSSGQLFQFLNNHCYCLKIDFVVFKVVCYAMILISTIAGFLLQLLKTFEIANDTRRSSITFFLAITWQFWQVVITPIKSRFAWSLWLFAFDLDTKTKNPHQFCFFFFSWHLLIDGHHGGKHDSLEMMIVAIEHFL